MDLNTFHEQRQFIRILFNTEVELNLGRVSLPTRLVDLSLRGALVKKPAFPDQASLQTGQTATLKIHFSEGQFCIVMKGRIVHIEADTVGLCCEETDVDSAAHLRRLIELNAGDQYLLERELTALISARFSAKSHQARPQGVQPQ